MFVNTNYHPNIHSVEKQGNVTEIVEKSITQPQRLKNDKFQKSTQEENILTDTNDYVYGSPEYACKAYLQQAALASLCQRVDDSVPIKTNLKPKHKRVERTQKSDYTHNDEAYAKEQADGEKSSGNRKY